MITQVCPVVSFSGEPEVLFAGRNEDGDDCSFQIPIADAKSLADGICKAIEKARQMAGQQ